MNEIISLVLSLSISGSILAILILAIKPLIRHRLSKSIQYYIWIVVLLRLILPFSAEESIMNNFFSKEKTTVATSLPEQENINPAPAGPDVQPIASNSTYNNNTDHSRYFSSWLTQYVVYIWLLGVLITLLINLSRYIYFLKHLKQANRPAAAIENTILAGLLKGRQNVRLVRNPLVAGPVLIGIFKPLIIIPDISFTEKQIKNILLHEVVHLKRFDVVIKWLTLVAVSLHWFNPMVYFARREINHACELSCDEAVVKNLNNEEKQDYGDTLITVVSENQYPPGVLQATMSEEKETLKERLAAIMKYNKKPKIMIFISAVLFLAITGGAVILGGCTGNKADVLYENNDFSFSLVIPQDFMNEVEIKEFDSGVYFVNKEIQAMLPDQILGVVGRIEIYDKQMFTREDLQRNGDVYGLRYLGENKKYYFGWAHATDVQFLPNTSHQIIEEYRAQEAKFGEIIKTFKIINTSELAFSSQQEDIRDSFYKSVNYKPNQDLLSFRIPETTPAGYKFYLHVSGRQFIDKASGYGISFHAFDEESQNFSWENGKTYTYSLKSESLDECLLVFGLINPNNQEFLYTIHISPDGSKSIDNTYKLLAFIKNYDQQTGRLTFDEIEWLTLEDKKRIQELGLNADLDFPNGYYICNESEEENRLKTAADVKIYIVNWDDLTNHLLTDVNGFNQRMAEYSAPYHLTIKEGVIVEILEQYRP